MRKLINEVLMNAIANHITDWYLRMLYPLSDETKLDLISKLTASMSHKRNKVVADENFFDELTGAWDDGVSPEEEMKSLRESRSFGHTRTLEDF